MKKYILTEETILVDSKKLYRIKATKDFSDVKEGDLGGYVESEDNLSHNGDCWIYGSAIVCDSAIVCGSAKVCDSATVCGEATVYGSAKIYGSAIVCGEAKIYGSATVYGEDKVAGNADVSRKILI